MWIAKLSKSSLDNIMPFVGVSTTAKGLRLAPIMTDLANLDLVLPNTPMLTFCDRMTTLAQWRLPLPKWGIYHIQSMHMPAAIQLTGIPSSPVLWIWQLQWSADSTLSQSSVAAVFQQA